MPLNEQPNNKVDAPSTRKEGVADPSADLSPDQIKSFYNSLNNLLKQSSDIFFRNAHYWPKHKLSEETTEQNDYQWVQHRYRNMLNNAQGFFMNPNRATYKQYLEPVRDCLADTSDLEHMRAMARKYLNAKQAKHDGYSDPDPRLMRQAMDWIDKVEKLTADFTARINTMYPPGEAQAKTA